MVLLGRLHLLHQLEASEAVEVLLDYFYLIFAQSRLSNLYLSVILKHAADAKLFFLFGHEGSVLSSTIRTVLEGAVNLVLDCALRTFALLRYRRLLHIRSSRNHLLGLLRKFRAMRGDFLAGSTRPAGGYLRDCQISAPNYLLPYGLLLLPIIFEEGQVDLQPAASSGSWLDGERRNLSQ